MKRRCTKSYFKYPHRTVSVPHSLPHRPPPPISMSKSISKSIDGSHQCLRHSRLYSFYLCQNGRQSHGFMSRNRQFDRSSHFWGDQAKDRNMKYLDIIKLANPYYIIIRFMDCLISGTYKIDLRMRKPEQKSRSSFGNALLAIQLECPPQRGVALGLQASKDQGPTT